MSRAWASSTLETYGAGLLAFHVFCDTYDISEDQRTPATTDLMVSFVSTMAGIYSGSAICNYVSGVRAWHILHRLPWHLDPATMEAVIKGGESLAPPSSKCLARKPVTVNILQSIQEHLDLEANSRDIAVWACATCLFYGVARLGELGPSHIPTKVRS